MIGKTAMSTDKPIHHLTKVNKKRGKAVCSVCGPVDVYIAKSKNHLADRVYCKNRIRESGQMQLRKILEKKYGANHKRKARHRLSKIDSEKMEAVCSVCGQTGIRKRSTKRGDKTYSVYICNTRKREYRRQYTLSHYKPPAQALTRPSSPAVQE